MKDQIIRKLSGYEKFKKEYCSGSMLGNEFSGLSEILSAAGPESADLKTDPSHSKSNSSVREHTADVNTGITMPINVNGDLGKCSSLQELSDRIKGCEKCSVLSAGRKNIVFGSGNPKAGIVVVGEAPGADEDAQGLPFVGRAGKLLTDILAAIKLSRDEVYICNILKCRPPENRNPLSDEIENCEPYLKKQLEIIKPKLILALGTFAAQTLLNTKEPLGKLRGRFHIYRDIKMMVTYHPAALLRNPNWKRPTWEDVKMLREEYDKINTITT